MANHRGGEVLEVADNGSSGVFVNYNILDFKLKVKHFPDNVCPEICRHAVSFLIAVNLSMLSLVFLCK